MLFRSKRVWLAKPGLAGETGFGGRNWVWRAKLGLTDETVFDGRNWVSARLRWRHGGVREGSGGAGVGPGGGPGGGPGARARCAQRALVFVGGAVLSVGSSSLEALAFLRLQRAILLLG